MYPHYGYFFYLFFFILDQLWNEYKTHKQEEEDTITCTITSWYYIINKKIIQNNLGGWGEIKLQKKVILLVEDFFVLNSSTKTFQDMPFVQNDSPEKCFEKQSQLNLMIKPSKKFLKMLCHFGPLFQFFRKTRMLLKVRVCLINP